MKIHHVSHVGTGGAYIAARRIAESCQLINIDSDFTLLRNDQSLTTKIAEKLDFLNEKYSRSGLTTSYFSGNSWNAEPLVRIANLPENEVINLHWIRGKMSPVLDLLSNKRIVATLHDSHFFTGNCHHPFSCQEFKDGCRECPQSIKIVRPLIATEFEMKKSLSARMNKLVLVAPSKWLLNCLEESAIARNIEKHWIPNPVPTDFFSPIDKKLPSEELIVGILGSSLDLNKNSHETLEILEKAATLSNQRIKLVIIGERFTNATLEVQDTCPPGSSQNLVRDSLQLCDLFVYFSHADNLPNLLLEAQSCGVPVVSWNVGGIPETFVNGVTGFLLERNKTSAITELTTILQLRNQLKKYGISARKNVLSNFSYEVISKRYKQLYENQLKK